MISYRHEYKYFLNSIQEIILRIRASGALERDMHTGSDGGYRVRSLYFDDYDDTCLMENDSGTDMRVKFRMRYYNDDSSQVYLERKSKERGMTRKVSALLSGEECRALMEGNVPECSADVRKEKAELFWEMHLKRLVPKVIVSYERIPFVYGGGNVRITFDSNISSAVDTAHFLTGNYSCRPVLPPGESILEVKWDEVLPLHIRELLDLGTLRWTAFSKYNICRLYHL